MGNAEGTSGAGCNATSCKAICLGPDGARRPCGARPCEHQRASTGHHAEGTESADPGLIQIIGCGRLKSGVRLAQAGRDEALIQYEKSIQTAFTDVSNALIAHQRVRESRLKQEALVSTLQDRTRLAYVRYRGGVDTQLNALDADRDLFQAQLSLAEIRLNELLSVVQLYKALGGGWQ